MAHVRAEARLFRWGDLRKRVISAAILAPVALACLWLGAAPWAALLALTMVGLAVEWVGLCGGAIRAPAGLAVAIGVLAAGVAAAAGWPAPALLLLLCGTIASWMLGAGASRAVPLALGAIYVGLAGVALIWLRGDSSAGRANVLFLVLLVWASDIGAYLVGRLVGGPKLAPAISPGKTWSGAVGGLAAAIGIGLWAAELQGATNVLYAAAVAALLGVVAQAGDLLESFIKRRFGVKDSGRLIPGHGGLLDRLDGILTAAPAAALLALYLGRGATLWR